MTVAEAQREILALEAELGRRSLLGFTRYTNRLYVPSWHHNSLASALDRVVAGTCRRLMIFMPPQHGKTELASRNLPAYLLGRYPDTRIVSGAYNATRAVEVSGDVQKIIDSDEYRTLFPGTRLATDKDAEKRTAARFMVVGRRGGYLAAGVGQRIAGFSMDVGIVDDPIGSRAEAESDAYRKAVWQWWNDDISTRQTSSAARIILIQTRWHEDDLAGRLLRIAAENPKADQWEVVSFPAICEVERPGDPRKVGETLWPSQFSLAFYESQRARGVYEFSSLYQQSPIPAGGAMARREWFKIGARTSPARRRCRAWDLAATVPTPGRDPDYTVGTLLAENHDGTWTIEHVVRERVSPSQVDALMRQTAAFDGRQTMIREWEDPGQAGKAVTAAHRKMLAGYDYDAVRASGEKTQQWRPFLVQAEGGNVNLSPGQWNREWLDELVTVPYGRHDDQADSVALAFNALTAHVDRGANVAVVMPATQSNWQQKYFSKTFEEERDEFLLDVALRHARERAPDPRPASEPEHRRAITFGDLSSIA